MPMASPGGGVGVLSDDEYFDVGEGAFEGAEDVLCWGEGLSTFGVFVAEEVTHSANV